MQQEYQPTTTNSTTQTKDEKIVNNTTNPPLQSAQSPTFISTSLKSSSSVEQSNSRRSSVDYLREVAEVGQLDLNENASRQTDANTLIQTFIDMVNMEDENWKKRKRDASNNGEEATTCNVDQHEHACYDQHAIWDIIPQKFAHVKLHAHELPSTEFCKIMFLYGWAYSKYLVHTREMNAGITQSKVSSPTSPVLSQDGSSDDSTSNIVEPPQKKLARNPNTSKLE